MRTVAKCAAALLLTTAAVAVVVAVVPGLAGTTRQTLRFAVSPDAGSAGKLFDVVGANLRWLAGVGCLAALRRIYPSPIVIAISTALLVLVAALNAIVVGVAVGAYGFGRSLPYVLNVPVEWVGLAAAAVACLRGWPRYFVVATASFVAAGLLEVFVTPQ